MLPPPQPVGDSVDDVHLLTGGRVEYGGALLAAAMFFPTGIFALLFTFVVWLYHKHTHTAEYLKRHCNTEAASILLMQTNIQESGGNMEGAYKSARRAEACSVLSYRVGVVLLVTLALLLATAITIVLVNAIDTAHFARPFY